MNESEIKKRLFKEFQKLDIKPFIIDTEMPIPYKHIYLPAEDGDTKLELWCFKQDITIYKVLFDKSVKYKDSSIVDKQKNVLIDIVLEKDNAQNSHDVGLPFVILELKKSQPNTHEILTYSQKAEMIKTIFPYCQFLFLVYGKVSARTYRHGINFDEIISLEDINDKNEIAKIGRILLKHLKIAQSKLDKLNQKNNPKKRKI